MPVTVASLQAVLGLDNKQFNEGLKQAGGKLNSFASDFAKGFGMGLGISAFDLGAKAVSALGQTITGSIGAAREAIAINKDLEQTIKSTGGAAGVSADAARDLADSLSRVTNFEDDAIVQGEAMLLTFTKIGKDVFPRAAETMLDMAQKFGGMKEASVQLGKALNDPLRGVGALQRVGVTFSAQQKEQIKNFMAMNDIASAQGVILDELATEFGGQARALADPIIQLGNAFGNLQEKFGANILLPALNGLAQVALPAVNAAIDSFKAALPPLTEEELPKLQDLFADLGKQLGEISAGFGQFGEGLNSVAKGLGLVDEHSTALGLVFTAFGKVIGAFLAPWLLLAKVLGVIGISLSVVFEGFRLLGNAIGMVASKSDTMMAVWGALQRAGTTLWQIIEIIRLAWVNLINAMSKPITLPTPVTPGSPTPLEMGLRGIGDAIKTMPSLAGAFGGVGGMVPMAAGGTTNQTTIINMGGQSMSFSGAGSGEQALVAMVQMLRAQLNR